MSTYDIGGKPPYTAWENQQHRPVSFDVSLLTQDDLYLFNEGTHYRLYNKLGAHQLTTNGTDGTYFAVWAPNATQVSVMGEFNHWDKASHTLRSRGESGIWEGFIPGVGRGTIYKYHIISRYQGYQVDKSDPVAFYYEVPPRTASIVWDLSYTWGDQPWMATRHARNALAAPMAIYEVHLGSWMRVPEEGNRFLTYRELAPRLAEHVTRLGFTHVEFLPVMEHPFYGSWGYQTTGYYAPTSRYGTPQDLMYLIDYLHQREIGVILDWVPSHFPTDEHGPGFFDGTHLYEHADMRQGLHPDWNSFIFNYGRNEVQSFLLSSGLLWLEKYHVDGLRVDAVASMLLSDYSRHAGEWIPNPHGGRENLDAIAFLRRFNEYVYKDFPAVQTFAEESTAWPMVSRPTYVGGLGFGVKWDMGWMHDTLSYMTKDPIYRPYHHNLLTFRMLYAFTENFILPLSHDEVVHGKGSLLDKMPGDDWQKFANLRLMYGYMYTQPGKKLLFMGSEFGQRQEWNHDVSLDWHLCQYTPHAGLQRWVEDLNRLYRSEPALYELDTHPSGFEWIDCNDAPASVVTCLRKGHLTDDLILVVCNFTPVPRLNYRVGAPRGGFWQEVRNSDAHDYGGSGYGNMGGVEAAPVPCHGRPYSLNLTLSPLSVVFFKQEEVRRMREAAQGAPATRYLPSTIGAWTVGEGRCRFRVWAPTAQSVEVHLLAPAERFVLMARRRLGYHEVFVDGVEPGTLYWYRLDGTLERPDPASRCQPEDVHGPSQVVASDFDWDDRTWCGIPLRDYIVYELHVGTYTLEGTFDAIIPYLPELKALGITAIELMPIAQFPGQRNWGYDGVYPFAVQHSYGGPDGLKRLVQACHRHSLAVVLDVVYNHLGPDGNYLGDYGPYFTERYKTPWGGALNLDGPDSDEVRRFFIDNALFWVTEFRIDALRVDAVHAILDHSAQPFLQQLGLALQARAEQMNRRIYAIAESALNDTRIIRSRELGGYGLDAQWNDDFHHALRVLLTDDRGGYYQDFGELGHLAKAFREGFVYAGDYSAYRRRRHGHSSRNMPAHQFVVFAENHDQVGNRMFGERLSQLVSLEALKLAASAVLLSPFIPLLFMGEEYGEVAPFQYFISHLDPQLVDAVRRGRREEFAAFAWRGEPPDPQDIATFHRAKLDHHLRSEGHHRALFEFYQELIRLRKELPALAQLSKEYMHVVGFEREKILCIRRWCDVQQVWLVLYFGGSPTSIQLLWDEGLWHKQLDSAEARWGGPGSPVGPALASEGEVTLQLAPESCLMFARMTES